MNLPAVALPKIGENLDVSRSLSLVAPVLAIAVSLLVLFLVVWPKFNQIKDMHSSNEDIKVRAQGLEQKAQILATFNPDELEEQLVAAQALLPSNKEVFVFLKQIENASASSGILLNKVDVVPGTINEGISSAVPGAGGAAAPAPVTGSAPTQSALSALASSVQIKLLVTSSYGSLLQFMSSMYSGSRVVSIEDMSVATDYGNSQVRSSLTVNSYWKALPLDLGSIEKPVATLTDKEKQILTAVNKTGVSSEPTAPEVPLGKSDLFAPL